MAKRAKRRQAAEVSASESQASSEQIAHGIVRRINSRFNANVPIAAQRSGYHEPDEEERGENLPVPDGRYRVLGHDWIHEFRDGQWISSAKGRSDTDPTGIVDVA